MMHRQALPLVNSTMGAIPALLINNDLTSSFPAPTSVGFRPTYPIRRVLPRKVRFSVSGAACDRAEVAFIPLTQYPRLEAELFTAMLTSALNRLNITRMSLAKICAFLKGRSVRFCIGLQMSLSFTSTDRRAVRGTGNLRRDSEITRAANFANHLHSFNFGPHIHIIPPFMGIGSVGFEAVKAGRKALGSELKPEYFEHSVKNVKAAEDAPQSLFDFVPEASD